MHARACVFCIIPGVICRILLPVTVASATLPLGKYHAKLHAHNLVDMSLWRASMNPVNKIYSYVQHCPMQWNYRVYILQFHCNYWKNSCNKKLNVESNKKRAITEHTRKIYQAWIYCFRHVCFEELYTRHISGTIHCCKRAHYSLFSTHSFFYFSLLLAWVLYRWA